MLFIIYIVIMVVGKNVIISVRISILNFSFILFYFLFYFILFILIC